jgi:cytochrome bd-type quinol oxidase subunit 2
MHSFAWLTTCWTDLISASESCLPSLVTKLTGAVCLIFAAAFETLAICFWPGVIVLPLICGYTAVVYWLFRGKVREESHESPPPVIIDSSSTYPENS